MTHGQRRNDRNTALLEPKHWLGHSLVEVSEAALSVKVADREPYGRRSRRGWIISFGLFFALLGGWSLATPMMAAPDEPAHVIKAAAVAGGQFYGSPEPNAPYGISPYVAVQVPAVFAHTYVVANCFRGRPSAPATCAPAVGGSAQPVKVNTYVGRYPPLYYLLVGWPLALFPPATGIHLARLVSALLSSFFLAGALEAAFRSRRSRLLVLGVTLAATPQMLFLGGVINPSGLEISSAICLWTSLLVLSGHEATRAPSRSLIPLAGLSATVLVATRPLSNLWLLLIVATVFAIVGWKRVVMLFQDRHVKAWIALVLASVTWSLWWVIDHHSLAIAPSRLTTPADTSLAHTAVLLLANTGQQLRQMIGVVGWLDTPAPLITIALWTAVLCLVVALAVAMGRKRDLVVLVVLMAASVLVPVALRLPEAHSLGLVGQGKDTMPLVVGVPIVAAWVIRERHMSPAASRVRQLHLLALGILATAQIAMFLAALRRYEVGVTGPINFLNGLWRPPLPLGILVAGFIVATGLFAWWISVRSKGAAGSRGPYPYRNDLTILFDRSYKKATGCDP